MHVYICRPMYVYTVADPGGGVQGVRTPPLLGHDVGFLTLGPKLDPPFLLVDLRCSGGSRGGGG